jgi:fibronectin-binding autotransporter adhesin
VAVALTCFLSHNGACAPMSAVWLGGNGNWSNPALWSTTPNFPNNGNGVTYDAAINSGNVALDRNITVQRLVLGGGSLTGSFDLTLDAGLSWAGGEVSSSGAINLAAGSISDVSASSALSLSGTTMNNAGTVSQSQTISSNLGVINNATEATWNAHQGAVLDDQMKGQFIFNNRGNFVVVGGLPTDAGVSVGAVLNNSGSVTIQSNSPGYANSLRIAGGGTASGTFNVNAGSTLIFTAEPPLGGVPLSPNYTLTAGAIITGAGSTDNQGTVTVAGDTVVHTNFVNESLLSVQSGATLTLNGSFSQLDSGGDDTHLAGGTIVAKQGMVFAGGSLSGSGTITGNVLTNGSVNPGNSAGQITINGNLELGFRATLGMQIGGVTQGTQYDYIAVSGTFRIDMVFGDGSNRLSLSMLNGFESQLDGSQVFTLLTSNSAITGIFTNVANGQRLETTDGLASFQVNYGLGSAFGANNLVLSNPMAIPEPTTPALVAVGCVALGAMMRSTKRQRETRAAS